MLKQKQKQKLRDTISAASVMVLILATSAFAQDVIGAAPVSLAATATMKIIAAAGVGWGFMRLMTGRHTIEGLTVMAVGALGLAKTAAVAAFLGLGG